MKYYLSICLLLLSFSAHGGLVKWVDANGKVHYSDGPPPADVQVQKLVIPVAPAAGSDVPASKTLAEQEADYKKAQKTKEEADKKAAKEQEQTQAKQKYCADLRTSLTTLENSPLLTTYNSKGERNYMDDVARQQQIAEARKAISENCK